jgi:hypothetical protein
LIFPTDLHDRLDAHFCDQDDAKLPENVEVKTDEFGWIFYAATNDDGTDFGAVVRIFPVSGKILETGSGFQCLETDRVWGGCPPPFAPLASTQFEEMFVGGEETSHRLADAFWAVAE